MANNAIAISATGTESDVIGQVDHILPLGSLTGTVGVYCNTLSGNVDLRANEIIANTAYDIVKGDVRLNCAKVVGAKVGTPVLDLSRLAEAPSVEHPNGIAGIVVPDGETTYIDGGYLKTLAGVPRGIIAMWSGAINAVPDAWALCDGQNGTPDLRDKFIVGAGRDYAVGATGGAETHTHTGTAASTTISGSVGATTLTTAQMPSHTHTIQRSSTSGAGGSVLSGSSTSASNYPSSATGGGESHTHSLSSTSHSHSLNINATSNLPPYYALAYIMKL